MQYGSGPIGLAQDVWVGRRETADADAAYYAVHAPPGGAVNVPVMLMGTGLWNTDLSVNGIDFAGQTQPIMGVVDTDTDSFIGFSFSADDVASIYTEFGGGGARTETISFSETQTKFGGVTSVTPLADDGAALGTTSLQWSDVFLATGGVLAWNNTDRITHTASTLTVSGIATLTLPATWAMGVAANIVTWTAQSLGLTGANSTNNTTLTVENTSNAAAASHAMVKITVGGTTSTGDPQWQLIVPAGTTWYGGVDNSQADDFFIGTSTTVGSNASIRLSQAGAGTATINLMELPALNLTVGNGAAALIRGLMVSARTMTKVAAAGTTVTTLWSHSEVGALTIAQTDTAITVNKATGHASVGVTAGASVTITHSSAYRALTGGASVNVSGLFVETQTAGTTGNYQVLLAVSTGASPALADHVGLNAKDLAAGDTRLYVQAEVGEPVLIGNNAVRVGTAGTATGKWELAGATSGLVTVTVNAAAGTWTMTLPAAVGGAGEQLTDAAGNGVTSWAAAASRREYKRDIALMGRPQDALDRMLGTKVYAFNYQDGRGTQDTDTRYVGVMADEAPWAMHYRGGIINPVNTLGYTVLAVQALHARIRGLEARVAALT